MRPSAEQIRVVLVDDHVLVREGLRQILDAHPDLHVVGEAGDSAHAVELVTRLQPDIVLLDIEIPGDEVTTTVQVMRRRAPGTNVVILSMYDGPRLVRELLALGIRGYLLKSIRQEDLVAAIRSVHADPGRMVLSVSPDTLAQAYRPPSDVLSDREREVLVLTAQAMSNAQIGSRLLLTEATVKRHLRNIFVKLGAVSRIDAVNKAIAAHIIPPPDRRAGPRGSDRPHQHGPGRTGPPPAGALRRGPTVPPGRAPTFGA